MGLSSASRDEGVLACGTSDTYNGDVDVCHVLVGHVDCVTLSEAQSWTENWSPLMLGWVWKRKTLASQIEAIQKTELHPF